ncbi:MAG: methionyl-tRNA formyltransferase [Candidatus Mariimomonas ferrooxydans]
MRLVFFGTPGFSLPSLNALLGSKHKVLAVVTQPDRKSGRGGQIVFSPVKLRAQKAGLEIFQPNKAGDCLFISNLRSLKPSVIVVVAYGQILPPEIIYLPEFGCINVHASLLPKYRGAAPINWAIINGEGTTGVNTMLMDEEMDTGQVLLQQETEIRPDDTAGSLSQRLSEAGAGILIETLKRMENGSLKPVPQTGEASYARVLKKADGLINWSKSAGELCNFIRGVNPWPGAYSFLNDERVKISKAVPVDERGGAGLISKITANELLVGTGKGVLSILEIQPSGKPVMTVRAFLQGRRLKEGMKFNERPVD